MFSAIGSFSFRHRRTVLAVWVALFVAGLVAGAQLGHVLKGGGFTDPNSPSERAAASVRARLHQGLTSVDVVFSSPTLDARGPRFRAAEKKALSGLTPATVPGLRAIQTYSGTGSNVFISRDGHSSVAVLEFNVSAEKVRGEVDHLRALIRPVVLRAVATGDPVFSQDLQEESSHDLRIVELYALPITLIVLIFVFGTLIAATLPVVSGALAVSTTLGAVWILGHFTNMSIFVMNVTTLLGLSLGSDASPLAVWYV